MRIPDKKHLPFRRGETWALQVACGCFGASEFWDFTDRPTGSDFHRKIEWGLVWHISQDGDIVKWDIKEDFQAHMVPTPFILAKSYNSRTWKAQFFGWWFSLYHHPYDVGKLSCLACCRCLRRYSTTPSQWSPKSCLGFWGQIFTNKPFSSGLTLWQFNIAIEHVDL